MKQTNMFIEWNVLCGHFTFQTPFNSFNTHIFNFYLQKLT